MGVFVGTGMDVSLGVGEGFGVSVGGGDAVAVGVGDGVIVAVGTGSVVTVTASSVAVGANVGLGAGFTGVETAAWRVLAAAVGPGGVSCPHAARINTLINDTNRYRTNRYRTNRYRHGSIGLVRVNFNIKNTA